MMSSRSSTSSTIFRPYNRNCRKMNWNWSYLHFSKYFKLDFIWKIRRCKILYPLLCCFITMMIILKLELAEASSPSAAPATPSTSATSITHSTTSIATAATAIAITAATTALTYNWAYSISPCASSPFERQRTFPASFSTKSRYILSCEYCNYNIHMIFRFLRIDELSRLYPLQHPKKNLRSTSSLLNLHHILRTRDWTIIPSKSQWNVPNLAGITVKRIKGTVKNANNPE